MKFLLATFAALATASTQLLRGENQPVGELIVASPTSYNYYALALQQWCGKGYLIHGLWPDTTPTTWPTNCQGPSYSAPSGSLYNSMHTQWYDCSESQTTYLWQHEWETHGRCVYQQVGMTQNQYFQTALSLHAAIDDFSACNGATQCNNVFCYDLQFNPMQCP